MSSAESTGPLTDSGCCMVLEHMPDQASQKRMVLSYPPVQRMTDMAGSALLAAACCDELPPLPRPLASAADRELCGIRWSPLSARGMALAAERSASSYAMSGKVSLAVFHGASAGVNDHSSTKVQLELAMANRNGSRTECSTKEARTI